METLLPVGVAATALVLTYFTCIRPMRRGHCTMTPRSQKLTENPAVSEEIAQLRAEIATMRADYVVDAAAADPSPAA